MNEQKHIIYAVLNRLQSQSDRDYPQQTDQNANLSLTHSSKKMNDNMQLRITNR